MSTIIFDRSYDIHTAVTIPVVRRLDIDRNQTGANQLGGSCYNMSIQTGGCGLSIAPRDAADVLPASPGARLLGVAIDSIIYASIVLCCFVLGATFLLLSSNFGKVPPSNVAYAIFQWTLFASAPIWDVFAVVSWSRRGRTLGKVVANTSIVGPQGRPIGLVRALVRLIAYPLMFPTYAMLFFVAFLNALGTPFAFGTGLLAVATFCISIVSLTLLFADRTHRTVHDFLARTQVRRLR
jgi:uncharacterized RDD family membrane protein YckC